MANSGLEKDASALNVFVYFHADVRRLINVKFTRCLPDCNGHRRSFLSFNSFTPFALPLAPPHRSPPPYKLPFCNSATNDPLCAVVSNSSSADC